MKVHQRLKTMTYDVSIHDLSTAGNEADLCKLVMLSNKSKCKSNVSFLVKQIQESGNSLYTHAHRVFSGHWT